MICASLVQLDIKPLAPNENFRRIHEFVAEEAWGVFSFLFAPTVLLLLLMPKRQTRRQVRNRWAAAGTPKRRKRGQKTVAAYSRRAHGAPR